MPGSWPALDVNVTYKRLTQVREADLIDLMNHPFVRRQMPLMPPEFGKADCEAFTAAKEAIWTEHGYGPWVFFVAERFVGEHFVRYRLRRVRVRQHPSFSD